MSPTQPDRPSRSILTACLSIRIEAERGADRSSTERQLHKLEAKIDGLYDAIADGLRSDGLKAKLLSMEADRDALKSKLAVTPAPRTVFHPKLAEVYREKVAALQQSLGNDAARPQAIEILRGLIERVEVRWEEGKPVADLSGDILKLISLPSRESDGNVDFERSVKVFAGA